jgi:hypothetical protein
LCFSGLPERLPLVVGRSSAYSEKNFRKLAKKQMLLSGEHLDCIAPGFSPGFCPLAPVSSLGILSSLLKISALVQILKKG